MRVLDAIRILAVDENARLVAEKAVVLDVTNVEQWAREQAPGGADVLLGQRCVPPFSFVSAESRGFLCQDGQHWLVSVLLQCTHDAVADGWWLQGHCYTLRHRQQLYFHGAYKKIFIPRSGDASRWDLDQLMEYDPLDTRVLVHKLGVALLAFRFCHAKGVVMQEHHPARQLRRAAEREGRPVPVRHYTLRIAPITRVLNPHVRQHGLEKALHLCRGHFKDYTNGAGLFGKYQTEVFVPEHERGNPQRGIVTKDYSL